MKQTRFAGTLGLIRYGDIVGDVRIGGVSLPAIWPATSYDTELSLRWDCPTKKSNGAISGKPGTVARYGDSLEEDWDGCTTEEAEWAIIELGGRDIVPQLALLEGEPITMTLDYIPNEHHGYPPKADYEEERRRIGQWAACRYERCAGSGPGRISVERVERLYSTGILGWVGITPEYKNEEAHYERFAEVRWADDEAHAKCLRDEWIAVLVADGRRAQAEYEEILRTKKRVAFQDAGGSPYIGIITAGRYGEKGITVAWEWHWSPVSPLGNPIVDPGMLRLLATDPTKQQLNELGTLAKATSDCVLENTTKEAKVSKWARAAPWPFWTAVDLEAALAEVGLTPLDLPICYGTQAVDYIGDST